MPSDTADRARKVRALLDKAEATTFPAEAEALTAKATQLMAAWQITDAMLSSARPVADRGAVVTRDVELGKGPYVHARLALLGAAGRFQRCRVLTGTGWNGRIGHLVGFEADVDRAEMLYTSLLLQATTAATASSPAPAPRAAGRAASTTTWRRNFLLGFARRADERLAEAAQAAEADAAARGTGDGPATGASVALVLAERLDAVDDWIAAEYGRLGTAPAARTSGTAGWRQGQDAAARADLGLGGRVGGRQRALAR